MFSRRHNGKRLPNGARLRLSERTLRRGLKAWRTVRSAAAFPNRYQGKQSISPTLRRVMLAAVMRPEVASIGQAARIARRTVGVSERNCYRALRLVEAAALKRVYAARIEVLKAERLAREVLKREARR